MTIHMGGVCVAGITGLWCSTDFVSPNLPFLGVLIPLLVSVFLVNEWNMGFKPHKVAVESRFFEEHVLCVLHFQKFDFYF